MRLLPAPAARQAATRLAALALALVAVGGCTPSGGPMASVPSPAAGAVGAAAASSPVAELQAGLTALLVERTYLVAAATDAVAAADGALDAPAAAAALRALDAGSVGLADVLGAAYSEARAPLLEALRRNNLLLARHAAALARNDPAAALGVRRELVRAQTGLARIVRRVVPTLDAAEVADRLGSDVQAQLVPRSYARLHALAQGSAATARLLADGIASDRGLGSASTDAVRLRAELTGLLTEHVALVTGLAREVRTPGPQVQSARTALRSNATALAAVLGDAYPAAQAPFLRSWSAHLDRLEAYATARATGQAAQPGLVRGYPRELARLLAEHVRELPAQSSRTELEPALVALLAAVDAAASGVVDAPAALRQATADVLPAAALVSTAVAEDLRLS